MKQLFAIQDSTENKISFYHAAAFLISLPFDRFYSEIILIGFLLHTLLHINREKFRSFFTINSLLLTSVFLITLIGITYSHDKSQAGRDVQRQMAILLFPFILATCGLDWKKYKIKLLLIFSITCVCTIVYLYIDALRVLLYNKLPLRQLLSAAFINQHFSEPIGIHATYLAMYCLLSASVLLYLFLKESSNEWRFVYCVCILVLLGGILQLGSRSVMISTMIVAALFPFLVLKRTRRASLIRVLVVFFVAGILAITSIKSFRTRYISWLKEDLAHNTIDNHIPEPRIVRWQLAIQLVKQSPLTGYGSGSEKRLLNEAYFANKLYISYLNELNAHNQYLSMALKTGIWGLLIFLLTLFWALVTAIRSKDILFSSFLAIVGIVSFSENILDVNKGIFFYAFFFSLFVLSGKPFTRLLRSDKRQKYKTATLPVNKKENAATVGSDNYV